MNRRDFLKLSAATGLCVGGSTLLGRAWADGKQTAPSPIAYGGKLFVMVQAVGGWDPTLLCDPKTNLNNSYGAPSEVGGIQYAPIGTQATNFFTDHADKMTVINGVNVATNNHEAGRRHNASGRLGAGYPNLAALIAGAKSPESPMAFLTFGGYDRTQGVVAPVRDGNASRLAEIAYPERINVDDELSTYHSSKARDIIAQAREDRAAEALGQQELPRYQRSLDTLMTARTGAEELKLLQEVLPEPDANNDFRKCQLIIAAYKAGIGVSANLARGGFDTHDDHDNRQSNAMNAQLAMVNFLWAEAARQGVEDKLIVLMTSDFGRSPGYNGNMGKDHWSVTSMIAMGNGIPGNRVVGQTSDGHTLVPLDATTLQPVEDPDTQEGVRISPLTVHRGLRRILDVEGSDADLLFPLGSEEDDLPIFDA